jgi:hypothetical protein
MGLLLNLYSRDAGVILGLPVVPYQVVTGFTAVTTSVQTGWYNKYDPRQTRPNTPRFAHLARHQAWIPTYSSTTSYVPTYSSIPAYISVGTMAFMSPGGPMFRSSMI